MILKSCYKQDKKVHRVTKLKKLIAHAVIYLARWPVTCCLSNNDRFVFSHELVIEIFRWNHVWSFLNWTVFFKRLFALRYRFITVPLSCKYLHCFRHKFQTKSKPGEDIDKVPFEAAENLRFRPATPLTNMEVMLQRDWIEAIEILPLKMRVLIVKSSENIWDHNITPEQQM